MNGLRGKCTADIALIPRGDANFTNKISVNGRQYMPRLQKGTLEMSSKVMLKDHLGVLRHGRVESVAYTSKDLKLYNVIRYCHRDTNAFPAKSLTGPGDSGALIMAEQDISTSTKDQSLSVYGMAIGICHELHTFTVGNYLWDVLSNCKEDLQFSDFLGQPQ